MIMNGYNDSYGVFSVTGFHESEKQNFSINYFLIFNRSIILIFAMSLFGLEIFFYKYNDKYFR